ncbi:hypothetical protein M427DRAFT_210162 [Gonapodya prolifera JEL478]|uniref:Uncharacterized protein n=1 Tax=Gonapodya prolifera (strain JEL478) TaxID=1344416 RepID=A0A139ANW5_GONPJ|nr:hypothetical protein M427DRAFT_210162 [Gonapodya prolifera JEL478]|eukprot:KXS18418.1 hypothetical protein M427DRAFT_210162 [Gonapodya prolifera JEL478]
MLHSRIDSPGLDRQDVSSPLHNVQASTIFISSSTRIPALERPPKVTNSDWFLFDVGSNGSLSAEGRSAARSIPNRTGFVSFVPKLRSVIHRQRTKLSRSTGCSGDWKKHSRLRQPFGGRSNHPRSKEKCEETSNFNDRTPQKTLTCALGAAMHFDSWTPLLDRLDG